MQSFVFPIRIYVEDTDCAGIVYHPNYLNYCSRARYEWLDALKLGGQWQESADLFFPVIDAHLQFIKPARLHDVLEVVTWVKSHKNTSIVFSHLIRLASDQETIICKAEITLVCVNRSFKPTRLPIQFKNLVQGELA